MHKRDMKNNPTILFTIAILFMLLTVAKSLLSRHYISGSFNGKGTHTGDRGHMHPEREEKVEEVGGMEMVYPSGSNLPDCSHACGPCFPCRRVMVSFKCSTESCPIVYRCMCKGRYFHVPCN